MVGRDLEVFAVPGRGTCREEDILRRREAFEGGAEP